MKNTFNLNRHNASKPLAIFFIILLIIALIAGCGDDNVTNSNNPPSSSETLIFSLDSLGLTLDTGRVGSIDTTFNTGINADSIKATFTLSTNCQNDSAFTSPTFRIHAIGGTDTLLNKVSFMNQSHTIYLRGTNSLTLNFILQLSNLTSISRFFRAKNIKVYKLS